MSTLQLILTDPQLDELADRIVARLTAAGGITPPPQDAVTSSDDNTTLIDRFQLAEAQGISVSTVDRLYKSGRIPFQRISSRKIRFDLQAVREAMSTAEGRQEKRSAADAESRPPSV